MGGQRIDADEATFNDAIELRAAITRAIQHQWTEDYGEDAHLRLGTADSLAGAALHALRYHWDVDPAEVSQWIGASVDPGPESRTLQRTARKVDAAQAVLRERINTDPERRWTMRDLTADLSEAWSSWIGLLAAWRLIESGELEIDDNLRIGPSFMAGQRIDPTPIRSAPELARYTQHLPNCARRRTTAERCTCGLQQAWLAVARYREALEQIATAGGGMYPTERDAGRAARNEVQRLVDLAREALSSPSPEPR